MKKIFIFVFIFLYSIIILFVISDYKLNTISSIEEPKNLEFIKLKRIKFLDENSFELYSFDEEIYNCSFKFKNIKAAKDKLISKFNDFSSAEFEILEKQSDKFVVNIFIYNSPDDKLDVSKWLKENNLIFKN